MSRDMQRFFIVQYDWRLYADAHAPTEKTLTANASATAMARPRR
jgi:hypothetical protein